MSAETSEAIERARAMVRKVMELDGLAVEPGQQPTPEQLSKAIMCAREDAAMAVILSAAALEQRRIGSGSVRTARVIWVLGVLLAIPTLGLGLLLCWSIAYVIAGRFWLPPPHRQ